MAWKMRWNWIFNPAGVSLKLSRTSTLDSFQSKSTLHWPLFIARMMNDNSLNNTCLFPPIITPSHRLFLSWTGPALCLNKENAWNDTSSRIVSLPTVSSYYSLDTNEFLVCYLKIQLKIVECGWPEFVRLCLFFLWCLLFEFIPFFSLPPSTVPQRRRPPKRSNHPIIK